jgi:hypothetical protein
MVDLYQTYWCQHDKRVTIVRSGLSYLLLIVHITRANDTRSCERLIYYSDGIVKYHKYL